MRSLIHRKTICKKNKKNVVSSRGGEDAIKTQMIIPPSLPLYVRADRERNTRAPTHRSRLRVISSICRSMPSSPKRSAIRPWSCSLTGATRECPPARWASLTIGARADSEEEDEDEEEVDDSAGANDFRSKRAMAPRAASALRTDCDIDRG